MHRFVVAKATMESANPSLMFKLEIEHQVLLHLVALPCCRCYFAIQVENAQQKILKKKKKPNFFFHYFRRWNRFLLILVENEIFFAAKLFIRKRACMHRTIRTAAETARVLFARASSAAVKQEVIVRIKIWTHLHGVRTCAVVCSVHSMQRRAYV